MAERRLPRSAGVPTIALLVATGLICAGLIASAVYTFWTLSALREEYLAHRGHDIAAQIDAQVRGRGIRNNPAEWKAAMEKSLEAREENMAFIVLLDRPGRVLAGAGEYALGSGEASSNYIHAKGRILYVFEVPLISRQGSPAGETHHTSGWRLRLGLDASPAAFIMNRAYAQLLVSGVALLILLVMTRHFLRATRSFLALKAREEHERHLAALGGMAATLAHEIRNPLGAMKGLTQVVQEKLPQDHNTQDLMQTVINEAVRLEHLVNDLLTFANPRKPQIEKFDLNALVLQIQTMLQAKFDVSEVKLAAHLGKDPLKVSSDEEGLKQVLLNIVLNALEASPRGGHVELRAHLDNTARHLVIEVDDEGPGLGGKDPEELFQPFSTTKTKGSGLGLAVSRQIVGRLGGEISLEDKPEGGARCTLRLPSNR